eukprot:5945656-Prymnesium_polylepis.1
MCCSGPTWFNRKALRHVGPSGLSFPPSVGPRWHLAIQVLAAPHRRRMYSATAPRSPPPRSLSASKAAAAMGSARSTHLVCTIHSASSMQSAVEPHLSGEQAKKRGCFMLCVENVKWLGTRDRMGFRRPHTGTITERWPRSSGAAAQSRGPSAGSTTCTSYAFAGAAVRRCGLCRR